jgi:hypothetical protein
VPTYLGYVPLPFEKPPVNTQPNAPAPEDDGPADVENK